MQGRIIIYMILFIINVHGQVFTLNNNTIIDGKIIQYNENELTILSFDGREYVISWNFLHPFCRSEIKIQLGLLQQELEVETTDGVVLYLKTGGTVVGKLLSRNSRQLVIKNKNGEVPIPVDNIVKMEKRKIKITSVYSMDEVYQDMKSKYNFNVVTEQWDLAVLLLQIGAQDKAKKHIERVLELSPDYSEKAEKLLSKIEKSTQKEQEQKMIQRFQLYVNTGRFSKAESLLDDMQEFMTESQINEYRQEIKVSEKSIFEKNIPNIWMDKILSQITSLSLDRKITFEEAKSKLQEIEKNTIAEIAKKYSIPEDKVLSYFKERKGKTYKSSYKRGTFIVGLGNNTSKVKNFDKFQSLLQKSSKIKVAKKGISADEWWEKESSSRKKEWLQAYYFEQRLDIEEEEWDICPQCGANGFIKSGKVNVTCPYCQGVKFERTIIAK